MGNVCLALREKCPYSEFFQSIFSRIWTEYEDLLPYQISARIQKVSTIQKVRKVISTIKEIDVNNEIQIAFSSVIHRDDQDFKEEMKEIDRKLKNLCKGQGIKFINNNNIDGSCLNRNKLHLNKSKTALLVKKFSQALKTN